jgi:predicted nucleic acid-binding protein
MRVLFDTNIVLDVLLGRIPWRAEANVIFEAAQQGKITASMTTLSIANVFYVGRRLASLEKALQTVHDCLSAFDILPVERRTLEAALLLPGPDFEDKIQIAAAIEANLDGIITRDPAGFAAGPMPIFTPLELLKKLIN